MMKTSQPTALVWHQLDLRLSDNPALTAARQTGHVVPVYIWAPDEEGDWAPGSASRWWLHQSLRCLGESLERAGSKLILRAGPVLATLRQLIRETGATAVFWNHRFAPAVLARNTQIAQALQAEGVRVERFNGALLNEPWAVKNKSGKPFQVFTPYWKTCVTMLQPGSPLPAPRTLSAPPRWPESLPLEIFALEPKINWAAGLRKTWQPGETGARARLRQFARQPMFHYAATRNRPDQMGTSRLSPHLHFGEISPRQIWEAVKAAAQQRGVPAKDWKRWQFLAEVGWREFGHHLLFHFPATITEPLRPGFARFPWRKDKNALRAWQTGQTGYPLVDAGMRELWATGWMHNRVRMIVASFLVKDLLIHWREGARWFWDTLVDADLANNTQGWQWTAGCGADAAPYFRIFNPVSQGQKFDPDGNYVRQWVPELAPLPAKWMHQPWAAPAEVLAAAKIRLNQTYPAPIVRHAIAREVALEAYQNTCKR